MDVSLGKIQISKFFIKMTNHTLNWLTDLNFISNISIKFKFVIKIHSSRIFMKKSSLKSRNLLFFHFVSLEMIFISTNLASQKTAQLLEKSCTCPVRTLRTALKLWRLSIACNRLNPVWVAKNPCNSYLSISTFITGLT